MDNDENLEQQEEKISNPSNSGRSIGEKVKKGFKDKAKNIKDGFKQGMRELWKALPLKVKLIIIAIAVFIVFCATVIIVLADSSVKTSMTEINRYFESATSEGANLYKSTGSLLLATNDEIEKIRDDYFKEIEQTNPTIYQIMRRNYKKGDNDNSGISLVSGAIAVKDTKTLYEHLLNSEKYNFNRISWKKYTRSTEDGSPDMKLDDQTKLQYPEDKDSTNLNTFVSMVRPYVQNWIIPYSLYVGIITDNSIYDVEEDGERIGQFGYQFVSNGYHKITVNQYNLKNYTKVTEQKVYDIYKVIITKRVREVGDTGRTYITTSVDEETIEECKAEDIQVITDETKEGWEPVKYHLKEAIVFDKYINNEYVVYEYNLDETPDEEYIIRTEYKETPYEDPGDVSNDNFDNLGYDENTGVYTPGTYTFEYTVKKGYVEKVTSVWRDRVEQLSHEERAFKVSDVQEYISPSELTGDENNYYKGYENNGENDDYLTRLTLFDIVNAKEEIYSKYLESGEEYSDNIGYNREWMTFSFYTLRQAIKSMGDNDSGWQYYYGSSIGAQEKENITGSGEISTNIIGYSGVISGEWAWPAPDVRSINSPYGYRIHPIKKTRKFHDGIDIPTAGPIYAINDGSVVEVVSNITGYRDNSYGNYVVIDHGNGVKSKYCHLKYGSILVTSGSTLTKGQQIATAGSTGTSTGPHLHLTMLLNGEKVNPVNYIGTGS